MRRKKLNIVRLNLSGLTLAVVMAVAAVAYQCSAETGDLTGGIGGGEAGSGTPAGVTVNELMTVVSNPDYVNKVIEYKGFTVGFNPKMHVPNWVVWELTADETSGSTPRYDKFSADPNVVGSAETRDYSYSGYDRGHMAPAGDMKWDAEAMMNTFYMTNICPQAKSLNTGAWKSLEEKCRQWAKADSSIIIICGPVLTDAITEFIGDNRVAVPERFFKVVFSPKSMRGIGFIMPNGSVPGGMQKAAVSIKEVEQATGHDFFSALPDSIEDIIETQNDFHYWSTLK